MGEEQKLVAHKLSSRVNELTRIINGDVGSDTRDKSSLMGLVGAGHGHSGLGTLKALFKRQLEAQAQSHGLSDELVYGPPSSQEAFRWDSEWMRHFTLWLDAMIDEIEETRGWFNWKSWKKPVEMTPERLADARFELIDLLHFWVNAYAMIGGTPETLVAEYHAKRDENDERQKNGY